MEQLNCTRCNTILEIINQKYKFRLMIFGKLVWLQEEDPNEDVNISLIIRDQFFTSVLFFKDILEAISLIQRYRTMWWLELEYSITFTTLDTLSIFTLLLTMDWSLEVKIWVDSILLTHWSKRRKSQKSWTYWLLRTTSNAIRAQYMEEAPRRRILDWYWSCDQRRINIPSNTIECNYSSRNTSSLLYSKS